MKATYLTPNGIRRESIIANPNDLRDLISAVSSRTGDIGTPGFVLDRDDDSSLTVGFAQAGIVLVWIRDSDHSYHSVVGSETGIDVGYDILGEYTEADSAWILPPPVAFRAIEGYFKTGNPTTREFELEQD